MRVEEGIDDKSAVTTASSIGNSIGGGSEPGRLLHFAALINNNGVSTAGGSGDSTCDGENISLSQCKASGSPSWQNAAICSLICARHQSVGRSRQG